jgi:hypothetical protein
MTASSPTASRKLIIEAAADNEALKSVLDIATAPATDLPPHEDATVNISPVPTNVIDSSTDSVNQPPAQITVIALTAEAASPLPSLQQEATESTATVTDSGPDATTTSTEELITTFYTPTVDLNQTADTEEQLAIANVSVRKRSTESAATHYEDIIKVFQAEAPSKTYMAYGLSHPRAFTGTEALNTLQKVVEATKPSLASTRRELIELAEKLANEFWLFLPCGLQQKKARGTGAVADLEMRDTDSIVTAESLAMRKSRVQVHDDGINLYRLTKDALVLCDISNDTFEDFVAFLKDPIVGIQFKEGKLLMKSISRADCVFSRRRFEVWLQRCLRVTLDHEVDSIIRLLENRHVINKVPLKRCYRFRQDD